MQDQESQDEVRALLIQHEVDASSVALAAAVIALLMLRSGVSRTAVTVTGRHLFRLTAKQMAGENVVLMDGTQLYCPMPDGDGRIYRIPSMELVDPSNVPQPIVTTIFHLGRTLSLCQQVVGP